MESVFGDVAVVRHQMSCTTSRPSSTLEQASAYPVVEASSRCVTAFHAKLVPQVFVAVDSLSALGSWVSDCYDIAGFFRTHILFRDLSFSSALPTGIGTLAGSTNGLRALTAGRCRPRVRLAIVSCWHACGPLLC